jgi:ATP-dependent Lon protease
MKIDSFIDQDELKKLDTKLKSLIQTLLETTSSSFSDVIQKTSKVLNQLSTTSSTSLGNLSDVTMSLFTKSDFSIEEQQQVLEMLCTKERCKKVIDLLEQKLTKIQLNHQIQQKIKQKLQNSRKEFLLRQQLEAIKKELAEMDRSNTHNHSGLDLQVNHEEEEPNDIKLLEKKIKALELKEINPIANKIVMREFRRLLKMSSSQPEYSLLFNYLEFFVDLPWKKSSKDTMDIVKVQNQLDQDHFGLDKVKKRIIEYIAVKSLQQSTNASIKGPILCFVGPPGVGKTSLGKSIALATNRKFERVSLGGVHDESEIRGHRKTYIGAMPGSILNAIRLAESHNPVILLDEIDKLGQDSFRGDPCSALLEVLDPQQNHTFKDHYLNTPFDLSKVFFIATANSLSSIPAPLLDRMEIIQMTGYSLEQKVEIAKKYLIPRQIKENGLTAQVPVLDLSVEALQYIVQSYTREAGVRQLERQLATICRHFAVQIVQNQNQTQVNQKTILLSKETIRDILGPEKIYNELALRQFYPGIATGMSWSTMGGSILFVEVSCTFIKQDEHTTHTQLVTTQQQQSGNPLLQLTGQLGDVMKESAQLAISWVRANGSLIQIPVIPVISSSSIQNQMHQMEQMNLSQSLANCSNVHIHFPEGAISKDGPSAGIAIVCALISALTGICVPIDLAMTGEITLRGVILPVGGIREKVLAAIRAGIQRVLLPIGNQKDAQELLEEFHQAAATVSTTSKINTTGSTKKKKKMEILFVKDLKQVLEIVFGMKMAYKNYQKEQVDEEFYAGQQHSSTTCSSSTPSSMQLVLPLSTSFWTINTHSRL